MSQPRAVALAIAINPAGQIIATRDRFFAAKEKAWHLRFISNIISRTALSDIMLHGMDLALSDLQRRFPPDASV